jgi:transcriptional regulator CtsR
VIRLRNISDIIEQYIKQILKANPEGPIEIQRNDLADRFNCVPSQINYVISTRFTFEKGYLVESKRGGGGYIRIRKLDLDADSPLLQTITQLVGSQISQREAEGVIARLLDEKLITDREARMLQAAVHRDVLQLFIPERDKLRANLLSAMLTMILKG